MDILRDHLLYLLRGGGAHVNFDAAVKGIPAELRGKRPAKSPHSCWELIEHLRIAQWDILEFTRNPGHESPKWPEGYWPESAAPPSAGAWAKSLKSFREDHEALCAIVEDEKVDLTAPLAHGEGKTALREVLLAADHNAYHLGQLVLVRKLLGAWK